MKTIKLIILTIIAIGINFSTSAQDTKKVKKDKEVNISKVEVYYFHYTRRCETCNAVEDVTKSALTEMFGDKVSFESINLDEKPGKAIGRKLKVSGQTLLVVSGDTRINLTNEGFMNARSNPNKFRAVIKEKIDPLI